MYLTMCGRLSMKCMSSLIITAILVLPCIALASRSDRESKQAQLDAACESARERKLAPERAKYIEECVRDNFKEITATKPRIGWRFTTICLNVCRHLSFDKAIASDIVSSSLPMTGGPVTVPLRHAPNICACLVQIRNQTFQGETLLPLLADI